MMKRLMPFIWVAALALSGCASTSGARQDSASAGSTSAQSPWANDPHFIAPPH